MSMTTEAEIVQAPAAAALWRVGREEQRVVLYGVSWEIYQRLLKEVVESRVLTAYNRGVLEFMAPGPRHEDHKIVLHHLVELMAEVLALPYHRMGSTHWEREDVERGIDPDEGYDMTAEKIRRARRLPRDAKIEAYPTPDLVVEIDLSPSAVDRAAIYASLGVPEVWRFDGETLRIDALEGEGAAASSRPAASSRSFPVPPAALARRLLRDPFEDADDNDRARKFRAWLRAGYPPAGGAGPGD